MNLRITVQTQLTRHNSYIRKQTAAIAKLHDQASSGLRVRMPSDDPAAMAQILNLRSEGTRQTSHQANVSSVQSRLNQANSGLLEVHSVFNRARELALDAANDGTDSVAFETLAIEVEQLLERTLSLANSQAEGRSLFGGTATGQDPFAVTATDAAGRPAAIGYQGSDVHAGVTIGRDMQVDMLYSGESIFQRPGQDAFQALIGLRDLLRNGGGLEPGVLRQSLSQQVGALEQTQTALLESVGEISSSLVTLEGIDTRLDDLRLQRTTDLSELESADFAEVVIQLAAQQTLLSNTLAVTARTFDQNLLDLLG